MNSTPDEADDLLKSIPSLYSVKKSSEGKKKYGANSKNDISF